MMFRCGNGHRFWSLVHVILIWKFIIKTANSTEIKGNLPDISIISRILNEYVRPMMRAFPLNNPFFRTLKGSEVENAINIRISELRQYLQDNDRNVFDEDNFLLDGNDETAIIEFLPKTKMKKDDDQDLFKNNLHKYTKIREKIKNTLTKESVSERTKIFVLRTLDDMAKNLIEGQCNWKTMRTDKIGESYQIASKWNEGWQDIRNTISSFLAGNLRKNSDIPKYIEHLHLLLKRVTKDADLISKKYKIQCEFVPKVKVSGYVNTQNPNGLRVNWDKTDVEDDRCRKIIVCSEELRDFMLKFYQNLNDTTISVLNNYAEMYVREVTADDSSEKEIIISILGNTSADLEGIVKRIYLKEIKKFKLHEKKDQQANANYLTDFIKNNVNNIKEKIGKMLKVKLVNLRQKIVSVMREDINVNLGVDLGNLEQEFIKQICAAFRLCNGKYAGRRQNEVLGVDKNNVLVQVQLSLDNDLSGYRGFLQQGSDRNKTTTVTRYISDFNITRTTLFNSTMQS